MAKNNKRQVEFYKKDEKKDITCRQQEVLEQVKTNQNCHLARCHVCLNVLGTKAKLFGKVVRE